MKVLFVRIRVKEYRDYPIYVWHYVYIIHCRWYTYIYICILLNFICIILRKYIVCIEYFFGLIWYMHWYMNIYYIYKYVITYVILLVLRIHIYYVLCNIYIYDFLWALSFVTGASASGSHAAKIAGLHSGTALHGRWGVGELSKQNMEVSWNRGTPKSSILVGFSLISQPFWGTSIYGNPYIYTYIYIYIYIYR